MPDNPIRLLPFELPWNDSTASLTDVSGLLDAPAGRDGFIRVEDGHFVDGGGERFRILGVNMSFSGNFPDHDDAGKVAGRLAKFGINCVRLHHVDTRRAPDGIWDAETETKQALDPDRLDRLDNFVAELKARGIYVNINLKIGREAVEADGIPSPDALPRFDKGPDHFYPRLIELQQAYARDLLTHENPYTETRYVDETSVATIEINNESGLIFQWANGSLDDLPAPYEAVLQADWNAYLREEYADTDSLRSAWQSADDSEQDEQSLSDEHGLGDDSIPLLSNDAFGTWVSAAQHDWMSFLLERERKYNETMYSYIRDDLGAKQPITGTQIGFTTHDSQLGHDLIDIHGYWKHPQFPGESWDSQEWIVENDSILNADESVLHRLMSARLEGTPYTVSEYNHPAPNTYSSEAIPLLAAYAAFQDWDGIYFYSYSHTNDYASRSINNFFDIIGHTPKMLMMPVAAHLLLRSDIDSARETAVSTRNREELTDYLVESEGGLWRLPVLDESLSSTAPLIHQTVLRYGDDPEAATIPAIDAEIDRYVSDTGELIWDRSDPERSFVTVRTPETKGFVGFVPEGSISLGPNTTLTIGETMQGWANVFLTKTDDSRWLLVASGYAENEGMEWTDDEHTSVGEQWGSGPPLIEPIPLRLQFDTEGDAVNVYALDECGARTAEVEVASQEGGSTVIDLMDTRESLWYEIVL